MSREDLTKEQIDEAKRVIWRSYYSTVWSLTRGLIHGYFAGEYDDESDLVDRLHETTDGALVYTSDQHEAIFASESSSDALDEANGMETQVENILGVWAVLCLQHDVNDALQRSDLLKETLFSGESDFEDRDTRQRWLAENHGRFLFRIKDGRFFMVGELNAGQTDEVSFGLVMLKDDGRAELYPAYDFFKELLGKRPLTETERNLLNAAEADEGGQRVFMDYLLERAPEGLRDAEFGEEAAIARGDEDDADQAPPRRSSAFPHGTAVHRTEEQRNVLLSGDYGDENLLEVIDDEAGTSERIETWQFLGNNVDELTDADHTRVRHLGLDEVLHVYMHGRLFLISRVR